MLTQRRIDVLAERQEKLWIVEVKKDPGVSVIGQLIAYDVMLDEIIKIGTPSTLAVIANRCDPDLKRVLAKFNIKLFVV
jgi:hypothetical protein